MIESFGHYNTATLMAQKWTSASSNLAIANTGRDGRNCVRSNAGIGNQPFSKTFDNQDIWIVGSAVTLSALGSLGFMELMDSGTVQMTLFLNPEGTLSIRRGGSTVLATSTNALLTNTWYFIEWKTKIHGTTGYSYVKVNGVEWVAYASGDTNMTANAYANVVKFNPIQGGVSPRFCDIYICDGTGSANNDFLGDCKVECILPSGAGSYTQWTPSTGSNCACVDDNPANGDTDYVSAVPAGKSESNPWDSYAFGNLLSASGTIKGVQTSIYARKDDAGSRSIKRIYRRALTDDLGATVSLADNYAFLLEIMETDPIAAGAWTVANVNAAEFGVKLEA